MRRKTLENWGKEQMQDAYQSCKRIRFREIPRKSEPFNELNCRYEVYKHGSPNRFESSFSQLQASNSRNDINILELPAVEAVLQSLNKTDEKNPSVNNRDFVTYPTLPKPSQNHFKQSLSDKQQISDFVVWFQTQQKHIDNNKDTPFKKFRDKQMLIASGFSEMLSQIGKLSKHRSLILKMLWNKENQQVTTIIEQLNADKMVMEKSYLANITEIHLDYQRQIERLTTENKEKSDTIAKNSLVSQTLIHNLRAARRQIKRLEYAVKNFKEVNSCLKRDNLTLIVENSKQLANVKDVSAAQAKLLVYQSLQLATGQHHGHSPNILKVINQPKKSIVSQNDLEQRKHHLYEYLMSRMKQNPDERVYLRDEHLGGDDDSFTDLAKYFKDIINRPIIRSSLLNILPLQQKTTKTRGATTSQLHPTQTII